MWIVGLHSRLMWQLVNMLLLCSSLSNQSLYTCFSIYLCSLVYVYSSHEIYVNSYYYNIWERKKFITTNLLQKKLKQTKQTWYNRKTAEHVTCLHKGHTQAWPSLIQTYIQRKQTSRKRDWIFPLIVMIWASKVVRMGLYPGGPYGCRPINKWSLFTLFIWKLACSPLLIKKEACSPFYQQKQNTQVKFTYLIKEK